MKIYMKKLFFFQKKKFIIRSETYPGKLTLYTGSDEKSKSLHTLCRITHIFHRTLRSRIIELRRHHQDGMYENKKYVRSNFYIIRITFFDNS